ncbi:MAG: hypothetical protein GXO83_01235 [Chlorobi bacterium]|nr:hypothetical protein [Chlorobiota bacterium]
MNGQSLKNLFPSAISPWEAKEPVRYFDTATLYEYIDGGAELFISYDFKKAASLKYTSEDQPDIVVDIFDMGSPANAFGVFCHVREKTDPHYGQGAQVYDDAIVFWKGPYYISVMAYDITPEVKTALPEMAGTIDERISVTGPLPEILKRLPGSGLEKNSILYFHHYIWQNTLGFLADTNFLPIHSGTDAVLANYIFNKDKQTLLLVEYKNSGDARNALKNFTAAFDLPMKNPVFSRLEDGTWIGALQTASRFVLVFRGKNRKNTEYLIRNFQQQP